MKTKIVKGYRFVTGDLKSEHGETHWVIGEWQHQDGKLELCANGFHASKDPLDSLGCVFGSRWFHCEAKGKILHDSAKFCASDMRITKEIPELLLRYFAYECALHVLPIYEKYYPEDKRVRLCLEAVKRFLDAPTEKHKRKMDVARAAAWAAARDAAWAAARDAAWAAARDAEREWQRKTLKKLLKR